MAVTRTSFEEQLRGSLFDIVPFNVAVIDRKFNIVVANDNFKEYFGDWQGHKCHQAYKGSSFPCDNCASKLSFKDGMVRVSDETGVDRHGRQCHYVVHLAPVKNKKGEVTHIIEMSTDVTETRRWRREYDLLFERAACFISVIDKDFRIIRANENLRNTFGDIRGQFCYQGLKRRRTPCKNCPAMETFKDGREHISNHVGIAKDGTQAHYVVNTSPLSRGPEGVNHVIEIATDITEIHDLQEQLRHSRDVYESLIQNSTTGILAFDPAGDVEIMNPAAKNILGWKRSSMPKEEWVGKCLPDSIADKLSEQELTEWFEDTIKCQGKEEIPALLRSTELKSRRKKLGRAVFMQDQREVKKLEREKLDAERLAAVGQTVAGLAHTIKNLLMGLEGGMYMVDSGLKKADAIRITEGWDILQRNFEKTTTLVKDFLAFSKGRVPVVKKTNPVKLAGDIVDLYRDTAAQQNVELVLEVKGKPKSAPIDPDGMEACITNLVSNGLDAAILRENPGGKVTIRVKDSEADLIFEVEDNGCGMDQKVKQQVFTTFFTTKGGKGTGLGLLTTRKIVQEHGGSLEMETEQSKGSIFRITLPRARLEAIARSQKTEIDKKRKSNTGGKL